jgi:hypothetical protein
MTMTVQPPQKRKTPIEAEMLSDTELGRWFNTYHQQYFLASRERQFANNHARTAKVGREVVHFHTNQATTAYL